MILRPKTVKKLARNTKCSILKKNFEIELGNITNLNLTEKDTDFYNLRIDIDVDDKSHIDNIIKSLKGLPEVNSVERSIH